MGKFKFFLLKAAIHKIVSIESNLFDNLLDIKKIDIAITIVRQWFANPDISLTNASTAITPHCNTTIARSLFLMHFTGVHSVVYVADWQIRSSCFIISRRARPWRPFDERHSRLSGHLISVKPHAILSGH